MKIFKPYLIRAAHLWVVDSGYTPYITIIVDEKCPPILADFVNDGEPLILNISDSATRGLAIGDEATEFSTRFKGRSVHVVIPTDNIIGLHPAEEPNRFIPFPPPAPAAINNDSTYDDQFPPDPPDNTPTPPRPRPTGGRPTLTVVK